MTVYHASPIKRHRATKAEMEERAEFLIGYARRHAPVTVRQLFYAATVAELPGIEKSEGGYAKVQSQVLALRRDKKLPYHTVADSTRWMRKPPSFDDVEDALRDTARIYRKNLWRDRNEKVEVWLEKSALASVILPVTREHDVPLMPTGGYTSETFAQEAVAAMEGTYKELVILSLYDFDRSGNDAAASLQNKVERFGHEYDVPVSFRSLGLSLDQVESMGLPTRPAKRKTTADKRWPYPYAAELDAIPPDDLRDLVRNAIEDHLPADQLEQLKQIEADEREQILAVVGRAA